MRKALTIGELLVTMAIIGIIAILVLPGFMQNYHKKIYVAKLKRTVEMLETAINQACIDSNVSFFSQTPYAMASTDASSSDGLAGTGQQEFFNKYLKTVTSGSAPFADKYRYINKEGIQEVNTSSNARFGLAKLATGQSIRLYCDTSNENKEAGNNRMTSCIFLIDINGTDGPNVGGRDLFAIGLRMDSNELVDNRPSDNCGTEPFGYGCYNNILENNWKMEY